MFEKQNENGGEAHYVNFLGLFFRNTYIQSGLAFND